MELLEGAAAAQQDHRHRRLLPLRGLEYEVEGYGRCTVSVNQAEPPYIAVTDSAGAGYVFSLNAPEDTRALYEELMGASAGGM